MNIYKTIGKGRFEVTFQLRDWAFPLAFQHGIGGHQITLLCFEFVYWRGDFRYEKYDD